jgi:ADP-ribose pyrophosphatase
MKDKVKYTSVEDEKVVYSCHIFDVAEEKMQSPIGDTATFTKIKSPDWVTVILLNSSNQLITVTQWRHGIKDIQEEFVCGCVEKNEAPIVAACREVKEETGFNVGSIKELWSGFTNPAFMTNKMHIFYAVTTDDPAEKQNLDKQEFITVNFSHLHEFTPKSAMQYLAWVLANGEFNKNATK